MGYNTRMNAHRTSRHSRFAIPLAIGVLLVSGALFVAQQPDSEILAGQATVIDGDTLRVVGQKVRLQGLAAPEMSEAGGQAAKAAMIQIVQGQRISCELDGTTSHDRVVGICYVEGKDLAAELVRQGLARDCERFSSGRYREMETASGRLLPLPPYCVP